MEFVDSGGTIAGCVDENEIVRCNFSEEWSRDATKRRKEELVEYLRILVLAFGIVLGDQTCVIRYKATRMPPSAKAELREAIISGSQSSKAVGRSG